MDELIGVMLVLIFIALIVMIVRKPPIVTLKETIKDKIIPALNQFDPQAMVTTVCPVPLGATTCSHMWEKELEQTLEMPHEKRLVLVLRCRDCGLIDKTIQVTSPPPKPPDPPKPYIPPEPRSECRHTWEKEKTVTLNSAYEQIVNGGGTAPSVKEGVLQPWMFRKKHIAIRVCRKCGEIDRCVAANFDDENVEDEE